MKTLDCFKAYDIRGKVPEDLDEALAYKIGRAFVDQLTAKSIVVGYDIRLESPLLAKALKAGLVDAGAKVIDIGLCGTEEVYFNTFHQKVDGGIMITASHNPKGYNGMKLVSKDARPISGDTGLKEIEQAVLSNLFNEPAQKGRIVSSPSKQDYVDHLSTYVDLNSLKPLRLVMNAGNGSAAVVMKDIVKNLPFECVFIHDVADGNFPNGVPNPLLKGNRQATSQAVMEHSADFGIAWDGDFDRCFLFDETGSFIEGYYLVGLLAKMLLVKHPGSKIIHDPRLTWNTVEQVRDAGGKAILSKTGHAFIKERMRKEDAIYGGEMSAHHYFKEFSYCDSGMIPWLLIAELISKTGNSLSSLVKERMVAYPCSGELNYTVKNIPIILEKIMAHFAKEEPKVDRTDGISLEFKNWRMNVRASNTEPLLRLNVESKGNMSLVQQKVKEIEGLIK